MKCQPKANNNREAVVVCARHVVKRPSKRMLASIFNYGFITIGEFKDSLCDKTDYTHGKLPSYKLVIFPKMRVNNM